jgi:hypothetical protein
MKLIFPGDCAVGFNRSNPTKISAGTSNIYAARLKRKLFQARQFEMSL